MSGSCLGAFTKSKILPAQKSQRNPKLLQTGSWDLSGIAGGFFRSFQMLLKLTEMCLAIVYVASAPSQFWLTHAQGRESTKEKSQTNPRLVQMGVCDLSGISGGFVRSFKIAYETGWVLLGVCRGAMEAGKWAAMGGSRTEGKSHPPREAQNATGVDKYEARSNGGGQMGGSWRIED